MRCPRAGTSLAWSRPALLAISALAAFCYAWRATAPVNVEIYYAAAARSMSMTLHNFLFGAFDPAGTVSTSGRAAGRCCRSAGSPQPSNGGPGRTWNITLSWKLTLL